MALYSGGKEIVYDPVDNRIGLLLVLIGCCASKCFVACWLCGNRCIINISYVWLRCVNCVLMGMLGCLHRW